jgi:hypothetical protein
MSETPTYAEPIYAHCPAHDRYRASCKACVAAHAARVEEMLGGSASPSSERPAAPKPSDPSAPCPRCRGRTARHVEEPHMVYCARCDLSWDERAVLNVAVDVVLLAIDGRLWSRGASRWVALPDVVAAEVRRILAQPSSGGPDGEGALNLDDVKMGGQILRGAVMVDAAFRAALGLRLVRAAEAAARLSTGSAPQTQEPTDVTAGEVRSIRDAAEELGAMSDAYDERLGVPLRSVANKLESARRVRASAPRPQEGEAAAGLSGGGVAERVPPIVSLDGRWFPIPEAEAQRLVRQYEGEAAALPVEGLEEVERLVEEYGAAEAESGRHPEREGVVFDAGNARVRLVKAIRRLRRRADDDHGSGLSNEELGMTAAERESQKRVRLASPLPPRDERRADASLAATAEYYRGRPYIESGRVLSDAEIQRAWDDVVPIATALRLPPIPPMDFIRELERKVIAASSRSARPVSEPTP